MFLVYLLLVALPILYFFFWLTVGMSIAKFAVFALDKLVIFVFIAYLVHNHFSIIHSSGYFVYLWDILSGLVAAAVYTFIFNKIYSLFPLLGSILNFIISYLGVMTVYCLLIVAIRGGDKYFIPLLNNETLNNIVNYILIGVLAIFPWRKREECLE